LKRGVSSAKVETFNQLFPLGHAYPGFMDFIRRQNTVSFSHGMAIHPALQEVDRNPKFNIFHQTFLKGFSQ